MQAMFFLGIFGFIYAVIMSLTMSFTQTAMHKKLADIAKTEQIFADVEFALNNGFLNNNSDLRVLDANFAVNGRGSHELDFLSEYTNWSPEELKKDPWGKEYTVYHATTHQTIDVGVNAPVTAFVLISSGPDVRCQVCEKISNPTYAEIRRIEAEGDSDDIVRVFTTLPAVHRTWNRVRMAHQEIVNLIETDYRQQYERFLPRIEQYYSTRFATDTTFGFDNVSLTSWRTPLLGQPGYPTMASNITGLGAGKVLSKMPSFDGVSNFMFVQTGAQPDIISFKACLNRSDCSGGQSVQTTGWQINYVTQIDGRTLIAE